MKPQHEQIKQLTGMNDYALFNTVFETGMNYLGYETFYHEEFMSALSYTPDYWKFWQGVVESRNNLFLQQFGDSLLSAKELRYIYEALLDVRSLSIYPPDFNWSDGYNEYITNMINKINPEKSTLKTY